MSKSVQHPPGWYAVALSSEIARAQIRAYTRFGNQIIIFRGADGVLGALEDRCPHRSVRLRGGKVTPDGCVQCPYHGFTFQRSGECTHIPASPDAKIPQTLKAAAFVVEERDGLVFLWHGPPPPERPPLPCIPEFEPAARFTHSFWVERWQTRMSRAVENQLDMAHLPFVHKGTIGGSISKVLTAEADDILDEEGRVQGMYAGTAGRRMLELYYPNVWINILGDKARVTAFFAPVDDNTTDVYLSFGQRFVPPGMLARLISWAGAKFSTRVTAQDKPIVEDHVEGDARGDALVQLDVPIARYRRWRAQNAPSLDVDVENNAGVPLKRASRPGAEADDAVW